jgi:hypothetical protein
MTTAVPFTCPLGPAGNALARTKPKSTAGTGSPPWVCSVSKPVSPSWVQMSQSWPPSSVVVCTQFVPVGGITVAAYRSGPRFGTSTSPFESLTQRPVEVGETMALPSASNRTCPLGCAASGAVWRYVVHSGLP